MKVNDFSLHEECFGPTWTVTDKGEVYLQAFFTGNIIQIKNLDQIRRLPNKALTVSATQLLAAQQVSIETEAKRRAAQAQESLPLSSPPSKGKLQISSSK